MKKNLNEFEVFQVEKSQLDKVIGGKKIVDKFYSGSGYSGSNDNDKYCVQEFTDIYDDGSWNTWFAPCESRKSGNLIQDEPNYSGLISDYRQEIITPNRSTNNCTIGY